jgi:hypothetical protein
MLPNLLDIETRAGRITIGATVQSILNRDVQGTVTAIRWAGSYFAVEVDSRHSDNAANYELLSYPTFPTFGYTNPNAQEATSGEFEVMLPGEGERVYFAADAQQAIAMVAAAIGLIDQEEEVAYLTRRAQAGPVQELRWRGRSGLAYVSSRQERPAPLFAVGQRVRFHSDHATNTVRGLALYKDRQNYGQWQWCYFYAEARGNHRPMSEAMTKAAPEAQQLEQQPAE